MTRFPTEVSDEQLDLVVGGGGGSQSRCEGDDGSGSGGTSKPKPKPSGSRPKIDALTPYIDGSNVYG